MSDGQINRLLHLLERVATALERAHPQPALAQFGAKPIPGSAADVPARPTVVWSSPYPQMTAGSHDPV